MCPLRLGKFFPAQTVGSLLLLSNLQSQLKKLLIVQIVQNSPIVNCVPVVACTDIYETALCPIIKDCESGCVNEDDITDLGILSNMVRVSSVLSGDRGSMLNLSGFSSYDSVKFSLLMENVFKGRHSVTILIMFM
jgi:hypothetical protein